MRVFSTVMSWSNENWGKKKFGINGRKWGYRALINLMVGTYEDFIKYITKVIGDS